ncbi:putative triacylglycerol lipase [Helianthus annuus]|nr:putative triacylglycerol lipase [Helianthus annuus]KAJ0618077.1 putative triacylglycerol lipase [Helianthus annuus]KAJ0939073.1 putative triacylglycerol lipase [Helianthus annuus]
MESLHPIKNASVSPPLPPVPVPALYVIGDSSVDCGTNNFLGTLARADHLPYGRDFDTHRPTGRFSNGRVPVDFLDIGLILLNRLCFGRVVVMGLAPIGCAPYYLWQYNSQNGECIKPINNVILEFNFVMRYTVE